MAEKKIEIKPEMIEAGLIALEEEMIGGKISSPLLAWRDLVARIFRAMMALRTEDAEHPAQAAQEHESEAA